MNNIEIRNSKYELGNLDIRQGSDVENENLTLYDIIDYVKRFSPELLKDNETMNKIYSVQLYEIENLLYELFVVFDNNFISSLNLRGIQLWEKLLQLESNSDLSLSLRHELILTKRRFRPPFTRQNLQIILESVWGKGNFIFEIFPDEFQLIIDIHTNEPEVYLKFQNYIRNLIPANLYVIFSIQYTYLYLYRNKTYSQVEDFDYQELSRYSA